MQNYTTYNSFYKLIKSVEENPEFDTKQAQKKLRAYVEGNEFAIAEKAKAAGVTQVAFDRSGFQFHGRVKALAEAAREAGLQF